MDLKILAGLAGRIEWHDTIGSTNDRGRELASQGAADGFVVGTDVQTAGRGRKRSVWLSDPGRGLAFSVVVRPGWAKDRWGWLSLAAGLAVCEGLEEMGFEPTVKWPNDVLIGNRKVCGILIEAEGEAAVIGIGINVNDRALPTDLGAISLAEVAEKDLSREEVLGEVWTRLMTVLRREPREVAEEVWNRLAWREEEVLLVDGTRGRIRGFGANGELKVETADRLIAILEADGVRRAG